MAEFEVVQKISVDCTKCGSPKIWKTGKQGAHQRYLCRNCGAKFRAGGITSGHRYDAEAIGQAIRAYYAGMSYKAIAQHMRDMYDIPKPSKSTLFEWVNRYSRGANEILVAYPATTGATWAADELVLQVAGKKAWLWVVMDKKTRYILAMHLALSRDAGAAKQAFRKALAVAKHPPEKLITDKLLSYNPAVRSVMANTRHLKSKGIRSWLNNNMLERVNSTIRQRTKVLRGINDLENAQTLLEGWQLYYKFFREHEGIHDQTPARAARIDSPFKEWADVVRAKAKAEKRQPKPRMKRAAPIKRRMNLSKPKAEVSNGMTAMFHHKTLAPNKKHLREMRQEEKAVKERRSLAPQPVMPRVRVASKPVRGNLEREMALDFGAPKLPRPKPTGHKRRHR